MLNTAKMPECYYIFKIYAFSLSTYISLEEQFVVSARDPNTPVVVLYGFGIRREGATNPVIQIYSGIQLGRNSFCRDVVFDGVNKASKDGENISDQIYIIIL